MRVCWNRQTGTFEVRVSMTCGFKSHRSHHTCGEQVARRRFSFSFPQMPAFDSGIFFVEQTYFGTRYARSVFYEKTIGYPLRCSSYSAKSHVRAHLPG